MKIPTHHKVTTAQDAYNAANEALDLLKAIQAAFTRGDLGTATLQGKAALVELHTARASVEEVSRRLETLASTPAPAKG